MSLGDHGYYISDSTIGGQAAGKGIFSNKEISGGEPIVTVQHPLMLSLESERLKDTCANCYVWTKGAGFGSRLYVKWGTSVSVCAGCKRFRYCSKACQKAAWIRGHKHECKNLKPHADKVLPKAVLGCMEILVRRKHGLIDDQTWQLLCHLDSHVDDFKANGNYGGIELMAMGTREFSTTQDTFSKDFVAAMYARILSNSMTLMTPTFDPLGIVVDGLLCHINHSCDPNTYIVMNGPQMQLRALNDIKKGEELYISYIDPTMPLARRQSELQQRWFFTCKCSKCSLGTTTKEDEWAIIPTALPDRYKTLADEELERIDEAELSANYVGDSVDERRVAALQAKVFGMYEEEQRQSDPAAAIRIINEAISLCTGSGLWPAHRQPLPALRDDLIVNQLEVEHKVLEPPARFNGRIPMPGWEILAEDPAKQRDYIAAWNGCRERSLHVIPKLYPQMHHPIRVVQTWQMGMLAPLLASDHAEVAQEIDLALVTATLLNTVNVTARMSHGAESAFSKSVQLKLSEVVSQLLKKFGSKEAMNKAIQQQAMQLEEPGKYEELVLKEEDPSPKPPKHTYFMI